MALWYTEKNENYHLGVWKTEETEEVLRHLSSQPLPEHIQSTGKRLEYLAVRALCVQMGVNPGQIDHLASGKPFLSNSAEHISISHTKGYVAILLSSLPLIGIDIELKGRRIENVRKRFMHPSEEKQLAASAAIHQGMINETTALLLHWCTKESLFKAIPDEGVDFAKELHVTSFDISGQKGSFTAKAKRLNIDFQVNYRIETDFILTCCFSTESR
jgi:4'-phosphopantetheinyl transferase